MKLNKKIEWTETAIEILQEMERNKKNTIPTGISYIDEATGGICPDDLWVIGGRTGFGKTELCTQIALNASKKTKVCLFALEATRNEIQSRMLFREFCNVYYSIPFNDRPYLNLNFRNWHHGKINLKQKGAREIFQMALDILVEQASNLEIVVPEKTSLTPTTLCMWLEEISSTNNLAIIDHLHYLEHPDSKTEHDGVIEAVKLIRKRVLEDNKPVILVSHVRKATQFQKIKTPTIDDLHGSSEISKRATAVILVDRGRTGSFTAFGENPNPSIFEVAKYRYGGASVGFYGVHNFDYSEGFSKNYLVTEMVIDKGGKGRLELVDTMKRPKWAKSIQD